MVKSLSIHTLGSTDILLDESPVSGLDSRKVTAILIYLASTGYTYTREVLAEFFWEDRTQSQALSIYVLRFPACARLSETLRTSPVIPSASMAINRSCLM